MVEGGLSRADAAYQFNTTPKTVAKWVKRFRAEGVDGLLDRSSRPHSSPSKTPPATCAAVETLRRLEDEEKEFREFLNNLRFAKDKAEFDDFLGNRRKPPASETGSPETDAPPQN